jgi:hypothetical protein
MDDYRGATMPTEVAPEWEAGSVHADAVAQLEAEILCFPVTPKPRPVTDLQHWLDMCG